MQKKIVKYPIFLQCSELVNETYVKSLFTRLAYNNPPKEITITPLTIVICKTNKIIHHNRPPTLIIHEIIPILKDKLPQLFGEFKVELDKFKEPLNYKELKYKTDRKFFILKKISSNQFYTENKINDLNNYILELQHKHFLHNKINIID